MGVQSKYLKICYKIITTKTSNHLLIKTLNETI